jgi:hypothetical protein
VNPGYYPLLFHSCACISAGKRIFVSYAAQLILIICVSTTFFSSCISSPVGGVIFTSTNHHISGYETSGNLLGDGKIEKMGLSCRWGLFPFTFLIYHPKDANLAEALEKGGINKIGAVDRKSLSILGIFYRECVEVWGE